MGASGGVVMAELVGVLNVGVAVGVMLGAAVLAALNLRAGRRYAEPHALVPMQEPDAGFVVAAPTASQLLQSTQENTDAA